MAYHVGLQASGNNVAVTPDIGGMRIALTGGASGIGRACAEMFMRGGARVIVLDRHRPPFECDEYIRLDLADARSIQQAAMHITGSIDSICHVAGLPPRKGSTELILKVNFVGLRLLTEALLERLAPTCSMVSIASGSGADWREHLPRVQKLLAVQGLDKTGELVERLGLDESSAYKLSKQAVIAWTVANTAQWMKRGLRANTVSPGMVSTGLLGDFLTAFGDRASRSMARVGRAASAAEVAQVVSFLASEQSSWIRGVDLPIDGGTESLALSDELGLSQLVARRQP